MRPYKIYHIDSFTNVLFGGNPTVAVLDADSLSDQEMRLIAREMNVSETSFILKSSKADFRLRFFTPTGSEIRFCGHATVGALCAFAKENPDRLQNPFVALKVETNAGILDMMIDLSSDQPNYLFDAPQVEFSSASYSVDQLAKSLGISSDLIESSRPILLETNNRYLYLTTPDLNSLKKFYPDMRLATQFAEQEKIVLFCVFTNEAFDSNFDFHSRGFAPLVGIPEDPFTGSMQAGLLAYAKAHQMHRTEKKLFRVEQGHFMERPGFATLEIVNEQPFHVRLHAKAVPLFESWLQLP